MQKYKTSVSTIFKFALILGSLAASSCKKLIEIPSPTNQITTSQVFTDSANIMSALAGIYNNFNVTGQAGFHSGQITFYTGLAGDELAVSPSSSDFTAFYTNNELPVTYTVSALWQDAYKSIYQINACLEGIAGSSAISAGLKQQLLAEIKVIRALYYFNLTNLYGAVPLVTSTDYKINQQLPRAKAEDIYSQIITDLTDAQKGLSASYPSDGHARPNLYVAEALLAKVYLFRGEWAKAQQLAGDVINSNLYRLNDDLATVFQDGSQEALWQLPAIGTYSQTAEATTFIPTSDGATVDHTLVPDIYLSDKLLSAFEPGDQRKEKWLGLNVVSENNTDISYYFPYKYKAQSSQDYPADGYVVLRLADILLIRAEATTQLGDAGSALPDLNKIRQRAGLPNSSAVTPAQTLTAIAHERQTELFCEWGNRWYDLKRTDTIDKVLGAEKPGWKTTTSALFPVPLTEIQNNPFLTQNPGY